MRNIFNVVWVLGLMMAAAPVLAQETVTDIVTKANNVAYYEGNDGRARVTMTITDSQGRSRKRVFTILRRDMADGGEQKYFVHFKEPADVREMVYMVWKYVNKDDDRWLYLPAMDLVRRIAATDKRSSFVGSHFVYEDISGRSLDLDTHELTGEQEGRYVIKNTPKDLSGVEFSYFNVHIDKKSYMPVKGEYFDKQGKLSRTVEALEVKDINGHPTVVKSQATEVASGAKTIVEFGDVKYDIGLTDDIFTERYLRRPPQQWLE